MARPERAPRPRLPGRDDRGAAGHDGALRPVDAAGFPEACRRVERCASAAAGRLQRRGAAGERWCAGSTRGCRGAELHNLLRADRGDAWTSTGVARAAGATAARVPDRAADREHARSTCSTRSGEPVPVGRGRASSTSAACRWRAGYLNRPGADGGALRARSVRRGPGARLYRTGDLGALAAPTGRSSSWGGDDFQVKMRGFRIELGEIEARARRAPGGAGGGGAGARGRARGQAAGGLRGGQRRRRTVGDAAGAPARAACRSTWCPRRSCTLEALPLTPNGKVDRKALPAPEGGAYAQCVGSARRRRREERRWRRSGRRCSRWSGWAARQLLRAGRAIRCWR